MFPISVSRRVYRGGKGNGGRGSRWAQLITFGRVDQLVALFELIQAVTQGCGAQGAEFAQLLSGDRGLELSEGLAHLFQGRGWARGGRVDRGVNERERQGLVSLGQLQGDVVLGRGSAMFGVKVSWSPRRRR